MSLFFYGAIQIKDDDTQIIHHLKTLNDELNWNLVISSGDDQILEQLNISQSPDSYVIFELKNTPNEEAYDQLYRGFNGAEMIIHYRNIARSLLVQNSDTLEFGVNEDVNQSYLLQPLQIPLIVFLSRIFEKYSDRKVIICIDHDFESGLNEIREQESELLVEAWKTIAMGYQWPNLRLVSK